VQITDGSLVRGLYLRMHADAPNAFRGTLAEAQAMTEAQWEARAERFATSSEAVAFIAFVNDRAVGFLAGYVGRFRDGVMRPDISDTVTLSRAWVDPAVRRQGIGSALAKTVKTWACERGTAHLETQVTEDNEPAIAFYHELGFEDMGQREPLLSNPALQISFLHRPL